MKFHFPEKEPAVVRWAAFTTHGIYLFIYFLRTYGLNTGLDSCIAQTVSNDLNRRPAVQLPALKRSKPHLKSFANTKTKAKYRQERNQLDINFILQSTQGKLNRKVLRAHTYLVVKFIYVAKFVHKKQLCLSDEDVLFKQ